ncbi:FtsQ-type POTRA domain-containing protein [Treponema sp. TIM-1]|uniref:cell division protein FtsQ/DivIB n=1 Tax=Treponema sp. TIM-1 TaxID=2898417 RepID=UPI0039816C30
MANYYVYTEDTASHDKKNVSALDRKLKRIVIILAMVVGAELCWFLFISPCMPLEAVEVTGMPDIERDLVLNRAGINSHSSYMTVKAAMVETQLEGLHQVESATVIKHFPDSVVIVLEPRKALAFTLARIGGKITPVFFDKQGVIFKIGNSRGDELLSSSIPLISGFALDEPVLGMRLPPTFAGFLASLERIHTSAPELLTAFSEIGIRQKTYNGFDLILYPKHDPVRIRAAAELNEDMLRYMMLAIDVIVSQGTQVDEIDFRTGTASYTLKEASSG